MENILEHCESDDDRPTSSNQSDEQKHNDTLNTTPTDISESVDSDIDEKDYQLAKAIEDNLLELDSETATTDIITNGNDDDDDSDTSKLVEAIVKTTTSSSSSSAAATVAATAAAATTATTASEGEPKPMSMTFDEDIILPSVRHDPEQEQKQRDRIKRKELKSKREIEEEEREKMQ